MKRLIGAKSLRRSVLDRWGYKVRSRGRRKRRYRVEFSCPDCGGKARESCVEYDRDYGEVMTIWWSSECGHVDGSVTILSDMEIPTYGGKSLESIATIFPSLFSYGEPFWERYEDEDCKRYIEKCRRVGRVVGRLYPARFGTLWQAREASADECRLLAAIQAEKRRAR